VTWLHVTERDVIDVVGADAVTFLQGQLSADVAALTEGESAPTLVLQPTGKLLAWGRVTHRREGHCSIDVDPGLGDAVSERLNRFRLRVAAELSTRTVGVAEFHEVGERGAELAGVGEWAVPGLWPAGDQLDVLGFDRAAYAYPDDIDVRTEDDHRFDRIAAGVPVVGLDVGEIIPAEAGVWLVHAAASFTKGCYVGQELVARVNSRGSNTPRSLRVLDCDAPIEPDATATSVATRDGHTVALALLARSVQPGDVVELGGTTARVRHE
jgi:folate-binding protein YgfZ